MAMSSWDSTWFNQGLETRVVTSLFQRWTGHDALAKPRPRGQTLWLPWNKLEWALNPYDWYYVGSILVQWLGLFLGLPLFWKRQFVRASRRYKWLSLSRTWFLWFLWQRDVRWCKRVSHLYGGLYQFMWCHVWCPISKIFEDRYSVYPGFQGRFAEGHTWRKCALCFAWTTLIITSYYI